MTAKEVCASPRMQGMQTHRASSQVIALVSLRPDHITLSGAVLEQLASESVESDQKTEIIDTGNADDIGEQFLPFPGCENK